MKNLFSSIQIFKNDATYQLKDRVIYNHEVYISNINNNNSLPSTGNTSVDNVLKTEFTKIVNSSSWSKI